MKFLSTSFVSLAIGISLAAAQQPDPVDAACTANLPQLAISQEVDAARSIAPRKRVAVLLLAADFLWTKDEELARSYFSEAFKTAKRHFDENGHETISPVRGNGIYISLSDLRFDTAKAVAKRDPVWSEKMINEILAADRDLARKLDPEDRSRSLVETLYLAGANAGSNPAFSLNLFRRAMREPLNRAWYDALYRAADRNRALADQVYAEALTVYAGSRPGPLLFLSAYPFARQRIFGLHGMGYGAVFPASFEKNDDLSLRFLQVFLARAASLAEDPERAISDDLISGFPDALLVFTSLLEMEPIVADRFPELTQRLVLARVGASAMLTDSLRRQLDHQTAFRNRTAPTFEKRIAELEEADSTGKLTDLMIIYLFSYMDLTEAQLKMIEPFLAKLSEPVLRANAFNHYWFLRSVKSIQEKRWDEVERLAAKTPDIDLRAAVLFRSVTAQMKDPDSRPNAFETLNRLSKLVRSAPDSAAKAKILFGLADKYVGFNRTVAFDELNEAVRVSNKVPEIDLLDTSIRRRLEPKGFTFGYDFPITESTFDKAFASLSKEGVDLPLAFARGFDDRFNRIVSIVAIARVCEAAQAAAIPRP